MRILALVPGGTGEQLMFFPTLETLKQTYPKAAIDVIVEPRAKSAYRVCPHVNEVLTFDYKDRNGLADYLNLLGIIRDREYDIGLTLGRRWTIGLLLWLNGIPTRIGYKTNTSWFISNPVPFQGEQYTTCTYHDLVQGLGIQSPCPPLKVTLPKEDIDWTEAELKRLDIKESGYILIYDEPGDSYPVAQWQTIIDNIAQKQLGLPIILLQTSENEEWVTKMKNNFPNLKITQPPDLGKLSAMIAGANLILCTDSVPMHLSVAVGTYTIALLRSQAITTLQPDENRYIKIQSSSDRIADIKPETILEQIWRG